MLVFKMQSSATALSSTLISLILLSQASITGATAARAACVHQHSKDLSKAAACGDEGSLQHCFRESPGYVSWGFLEQCFERAGCTIEEAEIEASFIVKQCDEGSSEAELRRRGPQPAAARTTIPLVARQDATTTTAGTSSIICSTETVVTTSSCPIQSTGTSSGLALPCFETAVTTKVCAADNVCSDDADKCMKRNDSVTGGTLFVVILLGVVFVGGFTTLLALCCLDKRRAKRLLAKKEAALIAKTNAANNTSASARPEQSWESPSAGSHPSGNPFGDPATTTQ